MQPSSAEGEGADIGRLLRRFGPIAAIVVIVIVVVVVVAGGGDDDPPADAETADNETDIDESEDGDGPATSAADDDDSDSTTTGGDDPSPSPFREGVIPLSYALEQGLDIDFGERCDVERGTLAIPDPFAAECMAPWTGDNGGATARGVTEDSIKIVWWIAQDADPVLKYITDAIINDDTNADDEHTMRALIEYFETYFETYGRKVELVVFEGSGTIFDTGAAIADAVAIAEDHDPFMVWGGPNLTNVFAQELHARGIPCLSCVVGQTHEYFEEFDGLAYGIAKSAEELDLFVAEYIGKRLAGDPAIHAGDETMHETERVFGRIWITTGEGSEEANRRFEANLAEFDVEISESQNYALDPASIQESAASVIAAMKEAGVTSVVFNGDPVAPREFTNEATAQNFWPEWIVTGSVLVDTAAFSRSYDQDQWANAFGISNLAARVDAAAAGVGFVYEWFHGEIPRADDSIGVIAPNPQVFYSVLQGVGPDLTIEGFQEAIFATAPTGTTAITSPALSWGAHGLWPDNLEPDYHGVDDVTEIWWDAEAVGPDEVGEEGSGLWRFVDGGQRYYIGELLEGAPKAFVLDGTSTIYDERPPSEQFPLDYEPLTPN